MDEKRVLELILKFGLQEEAKAKKAARDLDGITDSWKSMQAEANKTRKAIADALAQGKDATKLKADLAQYEGALRVIGLQAVAVKRKISEAFSQDLTRVGADLQNIGRQMGMIGAGGLAALGGLAAKYISERPLDEVSIRWLQSQKDIEQSFIRIGAVAANELLPVVEKLADLSGDLAGFVEKNPEVMKALVGIFGALAAGGALLQGAGGLMQFGGKVSKYAPGATAAATGALSGVPGAATLGGGAAAGAGALGVYAGAVGIGALIGKEIVNAIQAAQGKEQSSWGDIAQTVRQASFAVSPYTMAAAGAKALGFDEAAEALTNLSLQVNGLGDAAEGTGSKVAQAGQNAFSDGFAQQNVQMWLDHNKQMAQALENYEERKAEIEQNAASRRLDIIQRFGEQAAQAESRYAQARADAIAKFTQREQDIEGDYYRSRTRAAAQYGVAVRRAEQDHQRSMLKLQRDHQRRMVDLIDDRDAFGIVREQQRYEDARQEAEDSYRIQAAQRSEDFARQVSEMEENFRYQRSIRLRDFRQQQEEAAARHAEEMAMMEQNKAEQLALLDKAQAEQLKKLKEGYDKQVRMMETAFIDRLNAMSQSIRGNTDAWVKYMRQSASDFEAWLRALRGQYNFGSRPLEYRALGGWVNESRPYMVGERGPELFVPHNSGTIVPNNAMFRDNNAGRGRQGDGISMHIETQTLTLNQVMREVNKRLTQHTKDLARALGG